MKLCEKCHAHNADTRVFCADCGETLGEKLSDMQERQVQDTLSENIEKMYNKTDPLYVSTLDKILGIISIIGVVASVVCPFLKPLSPSEPNAYLWALLCFAIAALDAFIPQLTWGLEKMRLGLWVNGADDLEPSHFYVVGRRIGIAAAAALGVALLLITLFH